MALVMALVALPSSYWTRTYKPGIRFRWLQATRDKNTSVVETDRSLIHYFTQDIACRETKKRTLDMRPWSMDTALEQALDVPATQLIFDRSTRISEVNRISELNIQSVQARGRCLACNKQGHVIKDCCFVEEIKTKYGIRPGLKPKEH